MTVLCKIMGDCGSDKGHEDIASSWHNYTEIYYDLFKDSRYDSIRLFEMGIGTTNPRIKSSMGPNGVPGASLKGWAEFFPNAEIFGADIDRDIIFETNRIKTYYCDQSDVNSVYQMWRSNDELLKPFDIIIDDGLHEFDANVCLFENSVYKIKKGGFYIIEDLTSDVLDKWEKHLERWRITYPDFIFCPVRAPTEKNQWDNNLIVIQRVK